MYRQYVKEFANFLKMWYWGYANGSKSKLKFLVAEIWRMHKLRFEQHLTPRNTVLEFRQQNGGYMKSTFNFI
jgi:hypothetical protein